MFQGSEKALQASSQAQSCFLNHNNHLPSPCQGGFGELPRKASLGSPIDPGSSLTAPFVPGRGPLESPPPLTCPSDSGPVPLQPVACVPPVESLLSQPSSSVLPPIAAAWAHSQQCPGLREPRLESEVPATGYVTLGQSLSSLSSPPPCGRFGQSPPELQSGYPYQCRSSHSRVGVARELGPRRRMEREKRGGMTQWAG